jgi:hypothetical protein
LLPTRPVAWAPAASLARAFLLVASCAWLAVSMMLRWVCDDLRWLVRAILATGGASAGVGKGNEQMPSTCPQLIWGHPGCQSSLSLLRCVR